MIAALIVLVCALLVFLLAFRAQEAPAVEKRQTAPRKAKPEAPEDAPAPRRAMVMELPNKPSPRKAAPTRPSPEANRQKEQRHLELLPQIDAQYRLASKEKDPFSAQMEACIALCKKDIALAQGCKAYWESTSPKAKLPAYPSFARLALIHEKRSEYDKAVKVCEKALLLGFVDDGTKGGMQGRLARLQRKKAQAAGRYKP